jgi:hypothetical protein
VLFPGMWENGEALGGWWSALDHWTLGSNGSGRIWPRPKPAAKDRTIGTLCTPVKSAYFDRAVLLRLHLNSMAWEEGKSPAVLLAKQYGTQL